MADLKGWQIHSFYSISVSFSICLSSHLLCFFQSICSIGTGHPYLAEMTQCEPTFCIYWAQKTKRMKTSYISQVRLYGPVVKYKCWFYTQALCDVCMEEDKVKGKTDFNLTYEDATRGSHLQECCFSFCSIALIRLTGGPEMQQARKTAGKLKGENHLDYLSIHGRIILKWIGIEEIFLGGCRLDLSGSNLWPFANCFNRGNEHLTSINRANLLTWNVLWLASQGRVP